MMQQREEEADRRRRLDPRRVVAALAVRRVLGDVGCRAAVFAAQREALDQAQRDHQDRREPADRRVRRQQAHEEGRRAHEDDGDEERVLPSDEVADAAEDERAERAHEEAGGVRGEGRQQRGRLVAGRKEQRGEEGRQHRVQIEVVPLEHRAERGREDDLLLFGPDALDRLFLHHSSCFRLRHRFLPEFERPPVNPMKMVRRHRLHRSPSRHSRFVESCAGE